MEDTDYSMNRAANSLNPYQGDFKKVLCVCSAGLLRSPSAAVVLSQAPFNYNTRAAGVSEEYALVVVSPVLLFWADEIVCMEQRHADVVSAMLTKHSIEGKKVITLGIKDNYSYRDPELMQDILTKYLEKAE